MTNTACWPGKASLPGAASAGSAVPAASVPRANAALIVFMQLPRDRVNRDTPSPSTRRSLQAAQRCNKSGPVAMGCQECVNSSERERCWTQLMEQSLQGDARAYQELLRQLTVTLRGMVNTRARSAGLDAEDVVQEVLIALHLKRSTWVPGA